MIPNIAVGNPMAAMTEPKSTPEKLTAKDFKNAGDPDTSFKQALGNKLSKTEKVDKLDRPEKSDKAEKKESREEVKSTKEDRKSEAKGESKEVVKAEGPQRGKKASTRQQAIQEFMDSFESEFEIPPTRLVEAMANLDDAELTKSPEDTVNAVIDQLDLDDSQTEQARTMYAALLLQLQQTQPPPQKVPLTETTLGTGLGPQSMQLRVQAAHDKQMLVQQSVDKLNASFRMRQPGISGLDGKLAPQAMPQDMMQNLDIDEASFADQGEDIASMMDEAPAAPTGPQVEMPKMEELPPHLQGQMKEALAPGLLAALAARKAEMAAASAEKSEAMAAVGGDEASADILAEFSQALQAPKGSDKPIDPQALKALMQSQNQGQNLMQQDGQSQSFLKDANEFFKGIAGQAKEATETVSTKGGEFKHSLNGLEGLQAQPIKGETFRMDAAMPMAAPGQAGPANPAENEAAVKQLMSQAQYLIKKGGGEMKVEMTPEGMGTVHLKVMMQDGKVNLQMATDTQEAKKTIENSLAELKTSLAAHKLSVENVKIDVVNNVSTDTATQNQPNANNGNGGREQTRQFWNQFNENFGSQGRRESFSDMPGLKSYGRNRDPLTPIQTASERPRAMEGKGSGLNLVA